MEEKKKIVRISVRNLVEFILREGDIDNRSTGGLDKDAMLMGGRLHRRIQKSMGPEYHAEVSLKMLIPCGEFAIQVEGRADGIIIKEKHKKIWQEQAESLCSGRSRSGCNSG